MISECMTLQSAILIGTRVEQAIQACIPKDFEHCHPERARLSEARERESKDPGNADL